MDASWFITYIERADSTELRNMLIKATERMDNRELNEVFAEEHQQYESSA